MAHHAPLPPRAAPVASAAAPADRDPRRGPAALVLALLATVLYAVFAGGATDTPAETRVQLALALTTLATGAALATGRSGIRLSVPPAARLGIAALLAFAVWSGLTLLWSVAPDRTWMEINRAIAYALVAALGLVVGSSSPRALERVAVGWLVIAVVVALYALGGKTVPGVNLLGLDLDQNATLARLRAPLEYWNALALVLVMAVPVAVRIAVDHGRGPLVRTAAVLAIFLLVTDLGMTYSRGGVLALGAAAVVLVALGGAGRLKGVVVLLAAAGAAAVPLTVAFSKNGLTESGAPLGQRITDGRLLVLAIVLAGLALVLVVRALLVLEPRLRWDASRTAVAGRAAGLLATVAIVVAVAGLTVTSRGLPGTVQEAVRSFTVPTQDKLLDPSRLATTTSGNRWVWWKEAAGAFSDRPLHGWGAGSFRVTHLRYRTNTISVTQPHSVPLQFLAETGLVGLLLAYLGVGGLLWAAVTRVRALPGGREREFGVALIAAVVAWLVHGLYDWDWDIPGVTIPPLLFLGAVAARGLRDGGPGAGREGRGLLRTVVFADPERESRLRPGALAGVAAVTVALFAYAASAVLPAWSASKADAAQEAIGGEAVSDDELRRAAAMADLAAKLDPLSVEPLLVSATIAQRRGRTLEAREALLEAVDRQPESVRAWNQLGTLALALADREGFRDATAKALALDPHNPLLRTLAFRAVSFLTPPGESATATGTPLPGAVVATPAAPAAPAAPATPAPPATPATPAVPAPVAPVVPAAP